MHLGVILLLPARGIHVTFDYTMQEIHHIRRLSDGGPDDPMRAEPTFRLIPKQGEW